MHKFVKPNGPEIVRRREALGWSQDRLIAKAGCSRRTVQRVEKGHDAKVQSVSEIAQALNCTADELVISVVDSSSASVSTTHPGRALLLPARPSLCVGREPAIADIARRLQTGSGTVPLVVHGWPGVGKTTLAAVGVHDGGLTAPFKDGVLWASLGEEPDIYRILSTWCLAIDCAIPGPGEALADASGRLRAALQEKRVLLVIDDAWQADQANHLLVAGKQGAALVTTRLPKVAQAITTSNDQIIKLDVLSDEDGLRIIKAFVPNVVAAHQNHCLELVQTLEGLPLALQVAGRLLRAETGHAWGVVDLLGEIRNDSAALLSRNAPVDAAPNRTHQTVAALLNRSLQGVDVSVQQRYADLGAFAPKPATFDFDALHGVWDVSIEEARETVRTLVGRGLLDPVGNEYQMHALLAAHAQRYLRK